MRASSLLLIGNRFNDVVHFPGLKHDLRTVAFGFRGKLRAQIIDVNVRVLEHEIN